MIPTGGSIVNDTLEYARQPSLTWQFDLAKARIAGRVDGLESVKQAATKILQTQRFRHLIYTPNYGSELEKLIGMNQDFVKSEASRMLQEALMQDDRIAGIENVQTTVSGDSLHIGFTVVSTYGNFNMMQEVKNT